MINKIKRFSFIAKILRIMYPRFSTCSKCGLPWNMCESKTTYYNSSSGTFATCQYCWENSNLSKLKECYTDVYNKQQRTMVRDNIYFRTKYKMNHTLKELLDSVEKEYLKTHTISDVRKEKLEKLNNIK